MKRFILTLTVVLMAVVSAQAQTECKNCNGSGLEERTCAFCKA